MRELVAVILMVVIPASASAGAKDVCEQVESQISRTNYPVQLDENSRIIERSALLLRGHCYIHNVVAIDSDQMIDMATDKRNAQGIGMHRDTMAEIYLSAEGRAKVRDGMAREIRRSNQDLLAVPGVTVHTTYQTSPPIPPFTVTVR